MTIYSATSAKALATAVAQSPKVTARQLKGILAEIEDAALKGETTLLSGHYNAEMTAQFQGLVSALRHLGYTVQITIPDVRFEVSW